VSELKLEWLYENQLKAAISRQKTMESKPFICQEGKQGKGSAETP